MVLRLTFSALSICFFLPTTVLAQDTGTLEGWYATVRAKTDTVATPTGSIVRYSFTQMSHIDNPLFRDATADCSGASVGPEEGPPDAMSGFCFVTDIEGDIYWMWWRMDEYGTTNCPLYCGTAGHYNGTGKYEGMTSSLTWQATAAFANGNGTGISEGTYERR